MISVVIPALNSAETIAHTLSSIFSNEFPSNNLEVIVVDNGSVDGTEEIAAKFPVRLYYCSKRGYAPTLNVGIKKAKGELVCFTASDCIVYENWLEKISEFFDKNPDVDGVGGPVLSPQTGFKNDIEKFTAELWIEDNKFPKKVQNAQYMRMYSGGMLGITNCAYKKETLVSEGFFDESVGHSSDVDFTWRLIKKGRLLVFDPSIKVVHIGFPYSLQGVFNQQFRWGKNFTRVLKKYRSFNIVDDLKVEIMCFRQLTAAFLILMLPSRQSITKRMLRCYHYIWFHLGRIYGRG
ncbi:MAG: glycosyltransferase [Candidatus Bathyarchaeota archaeon]|nr:glycosyltransferase [Candidatus Bathyarchaeota archaeon]MDH5788470.1 glycosyltransferase [Candidatus Bathyarchaeota archaeon]